MFKNNLVQRVLFALVILIFTIPPFFIIHYCGEAGRVIGMVMLSIIGIVGMYEILTVAGVNKPVSIFTSGLLVLYFILPYPSFENMIQIPESYTKISEILISSIGAWQSWLVIMLLSILPILLDGDFRAKKDPHKRVFIVVIGIAIVAIFSKAMWAIAIFDFKYIFFFIPIAVISDTAAYFGGMFFGKKWFKGKKLAPKISPKKTWAGFIVGISFTFMFTSITGYYMHIWKDFGPDSVQIAMSIVMGLLLSIITPLGDLLFSWFKRVVGKKDFSNLIPGHGGVFDRLDAMSISIVASCFILIFGVLI